MKRRAIACKVTLLLLVLSSWVAASLGITFGLVDRPGAIKPHPKPVPFTGGTAILIALLVAAPIALPSPYAVAGAAVCWLVGLVDDLRGLMPAPKLLALLPPLALGSFALDLPPLQRVVVVLVGLILLNVFNVVDGLDALAGGTAVLMLVSLTFAGTISALAAAGIGATLGFLVFNLPPAKLFLGDEGSLLLGYLLWFLTASWLASGPAVQATILWSLLWMFPLTNFAYVVAIRLKARRPLLRGDRSHLYDDLKRRFGLARTLAVCWVISTVGAFCTAIVVRASEM